jgi:SAM-dependent methyltransferase
MAEPRGYLPGPASFDLVCDFYFLDRTLFAVLAAALRPGGLLLAAIHTSHEPADRLLAPGELGRIVRALGLTIELELDAPGDAGHRSTSFVVARR